MSLSFFAINCYAIVPTVANKLGVSCIGTSMGSTWYYVISPWMLGVFGFTAPTVLMMFLIVALFRKVFIFGQYGYTYLDFLKGQVDFE